MTCLALYLFGPPRLEVEAAPVETGRRKTLGLLAYLAVTRQSHSREALSALFWPEAEPGRASANLRHQLWEINQAVGEGWVLADRDTVSLNPEATLWLDVAEFRRLLAESQQAGQEGSASISLLTQAAALYQDHFLAGFNLKDTPGFDEWTFFEAESLRRELAGALETLVRCHAEQGQAEAAIPLAQRWLSLDTLNEAAHCQLMLLYEQAGQHNAALRQYQSCVRILRDELGVAPQPETTALYEKLRMAGGRRPERMLFAGVSGGRATLPAQLTSFIGREKEVTELKQLLSPSAAGEGVGLAGSRLVTLTGPGGTGKTRLTLQVAGELLAIFSNEVWLVELAALADPALVPQTVVAALGLHEDIDRPVMDRLIEHLYPRTALLILDNCEHLVGACAQLAETLLRRCPHLWILANSREALNVSGEVVYRVPSLSFLPANTPVADLQTLLQYEATRLFVERAAAALPGFIPSDDNALAIAQICSQLDGIPLAIELAATRVQMLRVEQIAARLDDRFRLLTGGSRTALPRHQTLRALIDWSYDLLAEPERALLRRLAVFAGSWTLEAAEAVGGDASLAAETGNSQASTAVLDLLGQLVYKSLVQVERAPGREARYRLLETIRQYGAEKLAEAGEAEHTRHQHLAYYLRLSEQAEVELLGPNQVIWLRQLEDDMDNIRTALEWSLEHNIQAGLRLAGALMRFWEAHSPLQDGIDWLTQLLQHPESALRTEARAKALVALGYLGNWPNKFVKTEVLVREALALYREFDNQKGVADALCLLGSALCMHDDYASGRPLIFESLALYQELGDTFGVSEVLSWLGDMIDNQDYTRARSYLEESLALCRKIGHIAGISSRLAGLGVLAFRYGDYASARPWLTEALEIQRSLSVAGVAYCISLLGEMALHEGEYEQARVYLEESIVLTRESGQNMTSLWSLTRLGYVALRQGDQAGARALFEETQRHFKEVSSTIGVVFALEGLASLAVIQGRPESAVRLFAWADATRVVINDARPPVEQILVDRDFALIHAQLDEATISAACSEGRTMTMEQAIACALESD